MIGRIGGAPIGSAATEMTHRKAITNGKSLNSMTMVSGRPKTDHSVACASRDHLRLSVVMILYMTFICIW